MKINCPWCGNPCDIDGNMVGGDAQCLHCGKDFLVHEDDVYDREVPQAAAVPASRDGGQPAASPTGPSSYVEETRTTFRPLACEMCGGTDLVKRDGVFVCQSCGTKYSLEEARKLMVSGTVNVAGTVKVDMGDRLRNLYQIARRAKAENNSENAAKYYDLILQEDPDSWEASFFLVYFKAMGGSLAEMIQASKSISNCLDNVFALMRRRCSPEEALANAREVADCIEEYFARMEALAGHPLPLPKCEVYCELGDSIERNLAGFVPAGAGLEEIMVRAWKLGIEMNTMRGREYDMNFDGRSRDVLMIIINRYVQKVQQREPDYRPPRTTTWWTVLWKAAWILLGVAAGVGVLVFLFKFGSDLLTGLRERLHW